MKTHISNQPTDPGVVDLVKESGKIKNKLKIFHNGTWREQAPMWLVTVAPSAAVTITSWGAELAYRDGPVAAVAAVAAVACGAVAGKSFASKWSPRLAWGAMVGSAAFGQAFVTVAGDIGVGILALMVSAAGAVGARLVYLHETREDRLEIEQRTIKTETARIRQQIAQAKLDDLMRIPAAPDGPYLGGFTPEETSIREAFWNLFGETLMTCDVVPTLSGWKARIGLTKMARKEARAGWDKVQTMLRLDGRFLVTDGTVSNELEVKFVNAHATADVCTAWDQSKMPSPEALMMSLGTDTETGEEVLVRFDERRLTTGASGTGKSWSTRPLLAHAHLRGELIMLDGKGEEANVWDGICRCATDPEEIFAAIEYAHGVMGERKAEMKERGLSTWDGEQLTVNVDEGQVVLSMIANLKRDKEDESPGKDELMQMLRELSSLGRSRGVVLWWQTQYGVTSGGAPGIDNLIAANMLERFSLRVANSTHALVALDDCAYYEPQSIPDERGFRGHGYLKGYGPVLIRTWTMDDAAVRSLPKKSAPPWITPSRTGASREDLVERFFMGNPTASLREAEAELGIPMSTVRRIKKQLG